MQIECQPPLVPDEVDLTDFKFMPLEVSRLLRSEFWMNAMDADTRIAAASINLWAESWHQRPAASLPNNASALARMAMVDKAVWGEIRDAVMAPWVLCSDGRWYHPVVAEKANAAWAEKLAYQERKRRWKENGQRGGLKRAQATLEATLEASLEATLEASLEANPQAKEERVIRKGNGKGKGKGLTDLKEKELLSTAGAADAPKSAMKGEGYTQEFEVWWSLYPRKDSKRTAFLAFQRAKTRVPVDRITEGARAYAARRKGEDPQFTKQPATWLNGDCWNDEGPPGKPKPLFPGYVPMAANGG